MWALNEMKFCHRCDQTNLRAAQVATQRSWKRPFGVGLLVAGYDQSGAKLFYNCPSGNFYEYKAFAIGARSQVHPPLFAFALPQTYVWRLSELDRALHVYSTPCAAIVSRQARTMEVSFACFVEHDLLLWLARVGRFMNMSAQHLRAWFFGAGCEDVPRAQVRGLCVVRRGRADRARAAGAQRISHRWRAHARELHGRGGRQGPVRWCCWRATHLSRTSRASRCACTAAT